MTGGMQEEDANTYERKRAITLLTSARYEHKWHASRLSQIMPHAPTYRLALSPVSSLAN